jgi:hypothetical protein
MVLAMRSLTKFVLAGFLFLALQSIALAGPGKILLGVSGTGDGMCANWFKCAGNFTTAGSTALAFDETGLPNKASTCGGCWASGNPPTTVSYPSNLGTGTIILEFSGTGALQLFGENVALLTIDQAVTGSGCTFTGSNATLSGTGCRVGFHYTSGAPGSQTISLPFGSTYTNMSFLIMCRSTDESAILAAGASGIVFASQYLSTISSLGVRIIRFMGAEGEGSSAINFFPTSSQFSYRLPLNNTSWLLGYWPQGALLGSSGSITYQASPEEYTATPSPDMSTTTWTDKELFWGITPAGSANTTTTPQVCITGRTPTCKTLLSNSGSALCISGSCGSGQNSIGQNNSQIFIYDAILNGVLTWSDTQVTTGIPIEVAIALCNQTGTSIWWALPRLYSSASNIALGQKIQQTLTTAEADFEYSNENWNFTWTQQGYLKILGGVVLGAAQGNAAAGEGYKSRLVAADMKTAWGDAASPILSFNFMSQWTAFSFYGVAGIVASNFLCTTVSSTCTNPQAGYTGPDYSVVGNRLADYISAAGYAPYTNGGYFTAFPGAVPASQIGALVSNANNWVSGCTITTGVAVTFGAAGCDTTAQQRAFNFVDWDLRQGPGSAGIYLAATAAQFPGVGQGWFAQYTTGLSSFAGTGNVPATGFKIKQYEGADQSSTYALSATVAAGMEGAATVYASGTSYSFQNLVVATDLNVYSSLVAGSNTNTGNTPQTHPASWSLVGRSVCGSLVDLLAAYKNSTMFTKLMTDSYALMMSQPNMTIIAQLQLAGPNIWSLLNGDIYSSPVRGSFTAVQQFDTSQNSRPFNYLLRRDLDGSNDNTPMWTNRVA